MCVDTNPNDSVLECDLPLPSGTANFLFQVEKTPAAFWWGDQAYYDDGGCGMDNGTVTVTGPSGNIPYTRVANNNGPSFKNGLVAAVP
jgi:hypothetical protein